MLTDAPSFAGALDHLRQARAVTSLPVLRKDFMYDPYQVTEARAYGADCILIIMAAVDDACAAELEATAADFGIDCLLEVHDESELQRALRLKSKLIGINNRDLRTFQVRLEHTLELAGRVPADCCLVSESGIRTRDDIRRLREAGVRAVLVGETLMRAADIGAKLDDLHG